MKPANLDVITAEFALGLLPSESLSAIADSLVDAGIITPSLAELSSRPAADTWESGHLFEESLVELGRRVPSREDAIAIVLRDRIQAIVAAPAYPQAELERFLRVFQVVRDSISDSDPLWALYGDADNLALAGDPPQYRGLTGPDAFRLMEQEVRDDAQSWLDAHGPTSAST
jgi:hypothetical protein